MKTLRLSTVLRALIGYEKTKINNCRGDLWSPLCLFLLKKIFALGKNQPYLFTLHSSLFTFHSFVTPSVSRVLSRTVINLRRLSPIGFGQNARATRGAYAEQAAPLGVASDRVYSKCMLPCKWVSSYLAFPSLPSKTAVYFCCTFPTVTCG